MPQYICTENYYYFRETGERKMSGDTITLSEAEFLSYERRHKGLLRPVDAAPAAIEEPKVLLKAKKPRARKVK